jgi:hypothetical protein
MRGYGEPHRQAIILPHRPRDPQPGPAEPMPTVQGGGVGGLPGADADGVERIGDEVEPWSWLGATSTVERQTVSMPVS